LSLPLAKPARVTTGLAEAAFRPGLPQSPMFDTLPDLSPRARHAVLLHNAALRRLRGLERRLANRVDDAAFWLGAAPAAVRKACALRETESFAPLP
jgi:hypothetical protein